MESRKVSCMAWRCCSWARLEGCSQFREFRACELAGELPVRSPSQPGCLPTLSGPLYASTCLQQPLPGHRAGCSFHCCLPPLPPPPPLSSHPPWLSLIQQPPCSQKGAWKTLTATPRTAAADSLYRTRARAGSGLQAGTAREEGAGPAASAEVQIIQAESVKLAALPYNHQFGGGWGGGTEFWGGILQIIDPSRQVTALVGIWKFPGWKCLDRGTQTFKLLKPRLQSTQSSRSFCEW